MVSRLSTQRLITKRQREGPRDRTHVVTEDFASYRVALEEGADYVEQDLAVTKDGVFACLHDESLEGTFEDVFLGFDWHIAKPVDADDSYGLLRPSKQEISTR